MMNRRLFAQLMKKKSGGGFPGFPDYDNPQPLNLSVGKVGGDEDIWLNWIGGNANNMGMSLPTMKYDHKFQSGMNILAEIGTEADAYTPIDFLTNTISFAKKDDYFMAQYTSNMEALPFSGVLPATAPSTGFFMDFSRMEEVQGYITNQSEESGYLFVVGSAVSGGINVSVSVGSSESQLLFPRGMALMSNSATGSTVCGASTMTPIPAGWYYKVLSTSGYDNIKIYFCPTSPTAKYGKPTTTGAQGLNKNSIFEIPSDGYVVCDLYSGDTSIQASSSLGVYKLGAVTTILSLGKSGKMMELMEYGTHQATYCLPVVAGTQLWYFTNSPATMMGRFYPAER